MTGYKSPELFEVKKVAWQRVRFFRARSEYAISRPSVIPDNGCWKMWYSYRGE